MSREKIFKLFACCFVVKGARRAAIYDLQRGIFETIPLGLADILLSYKNASYDTLISHFNTDDVKIIDSYFQFLIINEFGFWCRSKSEAERFPEMTKSWDIPFVISNAVIDYESGNYYDLKNAVEKIVKLGVPNVQFRFYSPFNINFLIKLMELFNASRVKTIEIFTQYIEDDLTENKLRDFCKKFIRLNRLIFFNSPESKSMNLFNGLTKIQMTEQKMFNDSYCGNIQFNLFRVNKNMFLESLNFNSCLNKKLGIDRYGNVKNCPSMKKSFGKISKVDLLKTIENESFKANWRTNKDKISICKDCEFRYMCVDCRAFTNKNNNKAKPEKCKYNPYLCLWENK